MLSAILLAGLALPAGAQSSELRASHAYTQAAEQGPLALRAFLKAMPKGADLHMHLLGAVYAETMLAEAAADGTCVDPAALAFDGTAKPGACRPGEISGAAAIEVDNRMRDALIDSFSMRGFVPVQGITGHDQFFATFNRFLGQKPHTAEWLDEVAARAAQQNEQYLEIMDTPDLRAVEAEAEKLGYNTNFPAARDALLKGGLAASVAAAKATYAAAEAARAAREGCAGASREPVCSVEVRFLFQILREQPPAEVFAQMVFAFELAKADPHFVGLNMVGPEDGFIATRDYRLHMRMLAALRPLYPGIHIALHAGEVAPGLVLPGELAYRIRAAVEDGGAERIGHGVDVMGEDDPQALLREMAGKHVAVEINLTSNDVILGNAGINHPLPLYLHAGVPVALSTDDEGVSRIDLTHEYARAASTYHLSYMQIKQIARASLEHAFLPGASLWTASTLELLRTPVQACRGQLGAAKPAGACAALVAGSERAAQQWELERRFRAFESRL